MQVGDIVKHFLTEQLGIVMTVVVAKPRRSIGSVHVLWTTKGESLFGPGNKEWCSPESLTVLTTA
jgi:hypothetical protein